MKNLRKADLHLHSNVSHDVPDLESLSPRALFEKALGNPDPARRMDYFTLTDHDTMDGYRRLIRELPEADRRLVIPGVEHTLRDPDLGFSIHVNLFLLDPDRYAHLRREVETVDDLLHFCGEHQILAQYNHPTWFEHDELRLGQIDFAKVPYVAEVFQVLELNAGRPRRLNQATRELAHRYGKALTANSDSHSGDVGLAHNVAPGDTAVAWLHNVWAGLGTVASADMTYSGMLNVVHDLIDAVLDSCEGLTLAESMIHTRHRLVEALAVHLLNSRWLRRPGPAREGLRLLLKQISRPAIISWLHQERRLARQLAATLAPRERPLDRARAA
ncbi:MAG: PHP domain-containing protein [Candidatus Krumholzibacteriia bacterium]